MKIKFYSKKSNLQFEKKRIFIKISIATIITITSLNCIIINSWIIIWIMLEMNTLSFCFLVKTERKQKEIITEIRIKYFIIQSLSSALLIRRGIIRKIWSNRRLTSLIVVALIIKIAASPFHKWFVNMVKKIRLKNNTLLITWQKLAPVYLTIFQIKMVVLPFVIISALIGRTIQINKNKMVEIIAYSSVFNLRWILVRIIVRTKTIILYSILYWSSVITVITFLFISEFSLTNLENANQYNKYTYLIRGANLGGIPPRLGFISKVIVINEILKNKMAIMSTLLLMIRRVNIYIYIRIFNFVIIKKTEKRQVINKANKKIERIFIVIIILPIIVICL